MKAIQKIIYAGFAAVAIASASMPVFPAHTPAVREGHASADASAPARELEIRR